MYFDILLPVMNSSDFISLPQIERTWSDVEKMEIKRSALMTGDYNQYFCSDKAKKVT